MNSIFGKPLSEVTYDDVIAFCQAQPKEGLNLDYKRDMSRLDKIVKTLISFANTNGGWVIIGVEDDGHDKPKLPVIGMSYAEGYEQRINNTIISMINPVVLPTYQAVHSADKKNTILIAFMPTSPSTPHWMNYKGNNTLFTRLADRAQGQEWEAYASAAAWEMLQAKRKNATSLREDITGTMDKVAHRAHVDDEMASDDPFGIHSDISLNYLSSNDNLPPKPDGTTFIRVIPEYPHEPIRTVPQILDMFDAQPVQICSSFSPISVPDSRGYQVKTYQQGAYISYKHESRKKRYFFGIDVFGAILNINPVEKSYQITKDKKTLTMHSVKIGDIAASIAGVLDFAGKMYAEIPYDTLLRIECGLDVSPGTVIENPTIDKELWPWEEDNQPANIRGKYLLVRNASAGDLINPDNRRAIISEMLVEILYSFNFSYYKDAGIEWLVDQLVR